MNTSGFVKVAPFLTHPLVLVGFGLFLVFSIHFAVVRLQKRSTQATRKILAYGFIIALVLMVLGFGLSFYQISRAPDVYRVRLTVLHPAGTVVEEAKLTSSVGGELKAGPGGVWELEIPASARPAGGKVQIFASRGALTGSVELVLGEDFRPPAVTVPLARREVSVRGIVVDGRNRSPAPSIVLGAPASSRLGGRSPGIDAWRLRSGGLRPLAPWPARCRRSQQRSKFLNHLWQITTKKCSSSYGPVSSKSNRSWCFRSVFMPLHALNRRFISLKQHVIHLKRQRMGCKLCPARRAT